VGPLSGESGGESGGALGADDRADIVETCTEMAWCLDERRWDDLADLFTEEVHFDYTELFGGEARTITPADLARSSEALLGNLGATQHLVGAHRVEGAGDRAHCRSMVQATHFLENPRGGPLWTVGAQYHMDLRRSGGRWRISSVRVSVQWATGNRDVLRLGKRSAI